MFTGSGIKTTLSIVSGYFYAFILGPATYGIWQTARVFIGYGSFINLGMPFVVQRDYPALIGENKKEEANKIAASVISFGFISFPAIALIILLIAFFVKGDVLFRDSLIAVALWFLVIIPAGIGNIMNKAINDYKTVGIAEAIYGLGSILIVPFIYWYGYYALLTGYLITVIAQSIFYYPRRPMNYHWYWNWALLKKLIFTAFPVFLVHVAFALFISIDKLIIAGMLDFKSVGLYSLSSFIASPISLMVSSLAIVLFTQLNQKYGRSQEAHVIEKHVFIPQKIFSNLLPPIIGMGLIALPLLTKLFLPKFEEGVMAAQINIFAIFFYLMAGFSANALFVLNKQRFSAMAFTVAGLIKTLGSYLGIKAGYGIEAVAVFSFIAYFFYDTLMFYKVHQELGLKIRLFVKNVLEKLICPLVIIFFYIAFHVYNDPLFEIMNISIPLLQILFGELIMIIVGLPFLIYSYRKFIIHFNKK